jgi:hypothetical protein
MMAARVWFANYQTSNSWMVTVRDKKECICNQTSDRYCVLVPRPISLFRGRGGSGSGSMGRIPYVLTYLGRYVLSYEPSIQKSDANSNTRERIGFQLEFWI